MQKLLLRKDTKFKGHQPKDYTKTTKDKKTR